MSSVMNLGMILGALSSSILTSCLISRTRHRAPFMIVSSIIASLGVGLMCTFTVTTNYAAWIGFQVLLGLGVGIGFNLPSLAIQESLPLEDVPNGLTILNFAEMLASAVFISVAQSIFINKLMSGLVEKVPDFDPKVVLNAGITTLPLLIPHNYVLVLDIYNDALVSVFYLATALAVSSVFGAIFSKWRSVERPKVDKEKETFRKLNIDHHCALKTKLLSKAMLRI